MERMSGKEAMMEGATAGRQGVRPKRADAPAAAGGEAQNDAVARRIRQADADIQSFSDALWLEDGLSKNTLQAYRRDLVQLARWLAPATRGVALAARRDPELVAGARLLGPDRPGILVARLAAGVRDSAGVHDLGGGPGG